MTKSDIAFLLENDVTVKKIRDYAGISNQDFSNMMNNYGFSKKRLQTGRKDEMATITVEEFIQLHHMQGLKRNEICELKGIKPNALSNWKWNHKAKIENALLSNAQPVTGEVKPIETKTTPIAIDTKTAEYERLIQALRNDLKEAHRQCDEKDEIIQKLENVNAACEDVENETASLREEKNQIQWEYDKLKSKEYHTSYTVENQKKRIEDLGKTLALYEKENKAMRALLQLWI
jgi:predicted RNase H-like nuclease (RuvC/YqgF family)